jgi:hypothetical protein
MDHWLYIISLTIMQWRGHDLESWFLRICFDFSYFLYMMSFAWLIFAAM